MTLHRTYHYVLPEPFVAMLLNKDFYLNLDELIHVITTQMVQMGWIDADNRKCVIDRQLGTVTIEWDDLYDDQADNPSPLTGDYVYGMLDACCIFTQKCTEHQHRGN